MLHKAERDCTGYGNENGENIMKRIANVKGVDTYNPNQPTGIYAYAEFHPDRRCLQPGRQGDPAPFQIEGFLSSKSLKGGVF